MWLDHAIDDKTRRERGCITNNIQQLLLYDGGVSLDPRKWLGAASLFTVCSAWCTTFRNIVHIDVKGVSMCKIYQNLIRHF